MKVSRSNTRSSATAASPRLRTSKSNEALRAPRAKKDGPLSQATACRGEPAPPSAPLTSFIAHHRWNRGWLNQLEPRHLGAFIRYLEIARHCVASEVERMRLPGLAPGERLYLGDGIVEFRVVRHED